MSNGNKSIFVPDGKNEIHDGIEHAPGGGMGLLDPTDTVFLLLDHQSGLFQNVKDIEVAQLRANTTALAKLATLAQIPVIQTASVPDGPNGPLMPEIKEAAPQLLYVPRKGEVNAWDNAAFVKAVRENRQKNADHGWCLDQRLRDVPCAGCQGSRIQSVRRDGCFGRPERIRIENDARTLHAGWRDSDQHQCRHLRSASHLEPIRRYPTRRALHDGIAQLSRSDRELRKGAVRCPREG